MPVNLQYVTSYFYRIQCVYLLGIASGDKGGFEADYEDAAEIVQIVIAKCIEKEALCNEFYLQLIKQTTDQPGKYVTNKVVSHFLFRSKQSN